MDVIIAEQGQGFARVLQKKIADIRRQLENWTPRKDAEALLALAEALLIYSHSQVLLKLPTEDLLSWLGAFHDFLRQRDSDVKVRPFRPDHGQSSFLLVNTPDVPYLVDTLKNLLRKLPHRAMIISHPILTVQRKDGLLRSLDEHSATGARESFLLVQFEGVRDLDTAPLEDEIRKVFPIVLAVGRERKALDDKLKNLVQIAANREQKDFAECLMNGNFICFGYAAVDLSAARGKASRTRILAPPLGWLPGSLLAAPRSGQKTLRITADAKELVLRDKPLVVEVLEQKSPLYKQDNLVYLGFREGGKTETCIEHFFVGLFSQNSANELAINVPPLRDKLLTALTRQHVATDSYDYRKVIEIFNTFPKVEMFFLSDAELDRLVRSFISLQREQSVKLIVTRSLSLRGITLLLIMPRDYYSTDAVRRMESYLGRFLNAEDVTSRVIQFFSDYVSLHFLVAPHGKKVRLALEPLQRALTDLSRPWDEKLRLLLQRGAEKGDGLPLWQKYVSSFTNEYKDLIHPRFAVRDLRAIEKVLTTGEDEFDLWGPFQERYEFFRLRFYSLRESYLNELMPFL